MDSEGVDPGSWLLHFSASSLILASDSTSTQTPAGPLKFSDNHDNDR